MSEWTIHSEVVLIMIVVDVDYSIDVVADPCQGSRWTLFTAPRPAQRCYLARAFMPVASLTDWGLTGVWMAMFCDFVMQGVMAAWRFKGGKWKSIKV